MTIDINKAKDVALKAVIEAGELLALRLNERRTIIVKSSSRDIATDIDLEAEKILINGIKASFPSHRILSEEKGQISGTEEYLWIIDPIDGSLNYAHAHPPFRTAVCLLHKDQPILSVMYGPTRKQMFVAIKGQGATLNDKRINVSQNEELTNSIFMTHLSSHELPRMRTILSLEHIFRHTQHVRMFGSGLASMCYIAEGKYDIFYNIETKPWDILPGCLLIEEAGGKVTDIKGKKITSTSTSVLATNGRVHDEMINLLKGI